MVRNGGICIREACIRRGGRLLYDRFCLDIRAGEITALLAPSGSGKTTLLLAIARLIPLESGVIERGEGGLSFLFQEPRLLPWYTIEQNIAIVLASCMDKAAAAQCARAYLEKAEIAHLAGAMPSAVSGGERQRAALARAFAYPARVLLLDEAFQSQDLPLKLQLMAALEHMLSGENRTAVLVTHDVREALCLADRVVVMNGTPLRILCDMRVHQDRGGSVRERYLHLSASAADVEELLLSAQA